MTVTLNPKVDKIGSVPKPKNSLKKEYRDSLFEGSDTDRKRLLEQSKTIYVGNLSCYTTESQLYELFSKCGQVRRVIMGLDRVKKIPCGFCFVEFHTRGAAKNAVHYVRQTCLDNRPICTDWDTGFTEGRQFGRGKSGGQVGDERARFNRPMGGGGRMVRHSSFVMVSLCLIALLACCLICSVDANIQLNLRHAGQHIRKIQQTNQREAFENSFANILVNIMKTSKPTLMKAFMRAAVRDNDLRGMAMEIYFDSLFTNATTNKIS